MPEFRSLRRSLASVVLVMLAGCSTHNTTVYAERAEAARASISQWLQSQSDAVASTQLTDLIDQPELTALVDEAIQANPGLQQTLVNLKVAHASLKDSKGDRLPAVSLGLSADETKDVDTQYSSSLSVSWELDFWRKLENGVDAARSELASSSAGYQAAVDTLAASIMSAWLRINLQQQLVQIEESRLELQLENERFILQRYRKGLGDLKDLDDARTNSATTRATLADYRESQASYQRQLALLLGQTRLDDSLIIAAEFPAVLQPLTGFAEQDLGRRPDLQSAYFDVVALQYNTDIAYKSMLPSLSLTASLADSNNLFSDSLFTDPVWTLLGNLTAPLFQGGKLKAQAEIAELNTEKALWKYQETLLDAVVEVENALGAERAYTTQQTHLSEALASSRRSEANYLNKYRQGLVEILDLLTVQQQTYDLQAQLATTTFNRLNNRITLGLALGLGVSQ